jgi:4a-hydroxytetrahydrobiopterin dehydratase
MTNTAPSVDMLELVTRQCTPLRGIAHQLSAEQIGALLRALNGPEQSSAHSWQLLSGELVREFRFTDYYRSIAFVNALAFIAHAQDHHPELSVHYNRVQVRFSTHDVGGLSINDFICAAKVQQLAP